MATTRQTTLSTPQNTRSRRHGSRGKPVATVGFGSAKVPVYRCESAGRVRFAISYHREGRRLRQFFTGLAAANKEALLVAQRIQSGMQLLTDPQVPFDLLLQRGDEAHGGRGGADEGFG